MGDQSAVVNNHSSKKNGSTTKSSKRTKLASKSSENTSNLNVKYKYLKERNYSFTKSGLNGDAAPRLSYNLDEMDVASAVHSEVSRSNAFSYSNVSCLNNTASIMDQQFARLIEFVKEASAPGQPEQCHGLRRMLQPMLCHLFLEMTKSRDGKAAGAFLKKYAPLVCPEIEDCDVERGQDRDAEDEETHEATVQANGHHDLSNGTATEATPPSFKALFKTLFNVSKKQDVDYLPDVAEFRASRFRLRISSAELFLLKRYLSKFGHILVLQILQSRFHIDVAGEGADNAEEEEEDDDDDEDEDEDEAAKLEREILDNGEEVSFKTEPLTPLGHGESLLNGFVAATTPEGEEKPLKREKEEEAVPKPKVSHKYYLDSLAEVVQRFSAFNLPINLHVLENATTVSTVTINREATLIAGGFEESHILVWPINQLPLPEQRHTRQPWSAREGRERPGGGISEAPAETCPHNEMDPELEYNGEALVVRGHRSAVTSVLYSQHHPAALYSASRDCTMRVWTQSENGYQCGAIYRGHNHPVWCLAESSNHLYLATGSKDATARLWVTEREFPVQVFAGHKLDIDAIDFHPNGNYLATASDDLTIRLWCVTSGKLVRVFTNCKQPVKDIKFSPDGQYLASVGLENKLRIYDLTAGQQLTEMKNASGGMESIAWNGNSQTLAAATSNGGVVRLFSLGPSTADGYRKRTYVTGCKKVLRVVANTKNSYTCIGINS